MLDVIYAECHYSECRYAEYRGANIGKELLSQLRRIYYWRNIYKTGYNYNYKEFIQVRDY
jgi:hypothetical protein